jgi:hypothetical protein
VYLNIFSEFVNQLTDDELMEGDCQQDGATWHTTNASMREIEIYFSGRLISKKNCGRQDHQTSRHLISSCGVYWRAVYTAISREQLTPSKRGYGRRSLHYRCHITRCLRQFADSHKKVSACWWGPLSAYALGRPCFATYKVSTCQLS